MLPLDYITGLVEGEGSFYASIFKCKVVTSGQTVGLGFSVAMAESDGTWFVLKGMAEALGCGSINIKKDGRPGHQQQIRYLVSGHKMLREKVVPFFLAHPFHGSKLKEFMLWVSILELVSLRGHSSPDVIEQVRIAREGLNHGGRARKS